MQSFPSRSGVRRKKMPFSRLRAWKSCTYRSMLLRLVKHIAGVFNFSKPHFTLATLSSKVQPTVGRAMQPVLKTVLLAFAGLPLLAASQTYTTRFEGTEFPISENGAWTNAGVDWTPIRKENGLAFGTQTGTNAGSAKYNDSFAHLTGFPPDQEAWGQVRIFNPDAPCVQELEILLRWTGSPHRTTGYECFARCVSSAASYVQIVRWDGPLGKFTYLADMRGTNCGLQNGDVLKASVIGNVITVYINGIEK